MNKFEAIKLLVSEGWTKADAIRALGLVNFKINPDELTIRKAISQFAGSELYKRQRLQAAQKAIVTKKDREIEQYKKSQPKIENTQYEAKIKSLASENQLLETEIKKLTSKNNELIKVNDLLKKDNKALKNIIDAIKLKLAIDTKRLLQYEDSEIRKALVKLFQSTLG
ncbi:MAG: hypothetical protein ACRC2R_26695 [Xenococcaceae cyanobacterium]